MYADGSRSITADIAVGARLPHIGAIGIALVGTAVLLGGAAALILRRALRRA